MNQQAKGQAFWLITAAICFSFILLMDGLPWVRGGLGALTVISLAAWFMLYRRHSRQQIAAAIVQAERSKDELLSYAFSIQRHDLLNDIQLLMAYVKMNKIDKLQNCVDNMKQRLMDESLLFKLGSPSLSSRLIALKLEWKAAHLTLEGDFPEGVLAQTAGGANSEAALLEVIEAVKQCSLHSGGEPNQLLLAVSLDHDQLRIDVEFTGAYDLNLWTELWYKISAPGKRFVAMRQTAGAESIDVEIFFHSKKQVVTSCVTD